MEAFKPEDRASGGGCGAGMRLIGGGGRGLGEEGGCHVKARRQRGTMGRAAGLGYDGTGRRGRRERDASRVLEEVASSTPRVSWREGGGGRISAKTGRVGEGWEGEKEGG